MQLVQSVVVLLVQDDAPTLIADPYEDHARQSHFSSSLVISTIFYSS